MAVRQRRLAWRESCAGRWSKWAVSAVASLVALLLASLGTNIASVDALVEGTSNVAADPACRSAIATGSPDSRLWAQFDVVSAIGDDGRIRLAGWLIDRNASRRAVSLQIARSAGPSAPVGAAAQPWVVADRPRPDVGTAFPWAGDNHGFNGFVEVPDASPLALEISAVLDGGTTVQLVARCTAPAVALPPLGWLDAVVSPEPGAVTISGWGFDPSIAQAVSVVATVDGVEKPLGPADLARPDVAAALPAAGPRSGFSATLAGLKGGSRDICVALRNLGAPAPDRSLGCRKVVVEGAVAGSPLGEVELAVQVGEQLGGGRSQLRVRGYAYDPDNPAQPVSVFLTVGGPRPSEIQFPMGLALDPRPDVAEALPGAGSSHGFDVATLPLAVAPTTVCVYADDTEVGKPSALIGCQRVGTSALDVPRGVLESVQAIEPNRIAVAGWAAQPPSAAPVVVRLRLAGLAGRSPSIMTLGPAVLLRPDVAALFPWAGPAHGFEATLGSVPAGSWLVCADAFGVGAALGIQTLLGCRTVIVRDPVQSPR